MKLRSIAAFLLLFVALAGVARAQNADPTGTWKWTVTFNDNSFEQTLNLKFADGKLTGTMVGRNGQETAITDGKFENGQITFKVVRERNGNSFTTNYSGKLVGDTIEGKTSMTFNDQTREMDWKPTRAKS